MFVSSICTTNVLEGGGNGVAVTWSSKLTRDVVASSRENRPVPHRQKNNDLMAALNLHNHWILHVVSHYNVQNLKEISGY